MSPVEARVAELWNKGRNMKEIAANIRKSRGAVAGIIHRLRRDGVSLPSREPCRHTSAAKIKKFKKVAKLVVAKPVATPTLVAKPIPVAKPKPVVKPAPVAKPIKFETITHNIPVLKSPPQIVAPVVAPTAPSPPPVSIFDIGDSQCRYIIKDDPLVFYCGQKTPSRRQSYCASHTGLVHQPTAPRKVAL